MRQELLAECHDYNESPEVLWNIIADLEGYADHVSDLASTKIVSGNGEGAVRECVTTSNQRWRETVSVWRPGRTYEVEVQTDTYPFPLRQLFRRFTGIWTIEATASGSRVCIRFVPDVRGGPLVRSLLRLGTGQHRKNLKETLRSYERQLTRSDGGDAG